ncbi:hypothetical protein ABS71_10620 [bacterium SCN 62-11]|nr:MAG: hypothetical protein ABS71_10620 [bacterium SCN 62-11]
MTNFDTLSQRATACGLNLATAHPHLCMKAAQESQPLPRFQVGEGTSPWNGWVVGVESLEKAEQIIEGYEVVQALDALEANKGGRA